MENKQTENKVAAVEYFWKLRKRVFGPNWSGGVCGEGGGVCIFFFICRELEIEKYHI